MIFTILGGIALVGLFLLFFGTAIAIWVAKALGMDPSGEKYEEQEKESPADQTFKDEGNDRYW